MPKSTPPTLIWSILAILRLILAAIVMCGHMAFFYDLPDGPLHFLASFNGSYAVLWFLAISGFSIAHSYAQNPSGYYGRRCWRIMPVYITCVLISFVPYLFVGDITQSNGSSTVTHSTFSATLLGAITFGIFSHVDTDGPIWSLGVEVIWYALAPLLARTKSAVIAILAVASFGAFYLTRWPSGPSFLSVHGLVTALVSWAWLSGFLIYRAIPKWPDFDIPPHATKIMQRCGDVSYPLYLAHMPVLWILAAIGFPMSAYVALVFVIAVSLVIFYKVDLPSREYRKLTERRHSCKSVPPMLPSAPAYKLAGIISPVYAEIEFELPKK